MIQRIPFLLASVALTALAASPPARADLIVNGGFETGSFSGWTLGSNDDGFSFVGTDNPNSGTYSAELGQFSNDGALSLSQTIATTVGQSYTFSFYMTTAELGFDSGPPDHFAASFGGSTVLDLTDVDQPDTYTLFSYTVVATSASTLVDFDTYNNPWFFFLDDVSVVPNAMPTVPAPPSLLMAGIPVILGMANAARRRMKARA